MGCSTGNATVDAVAKMNFSGNIIPAVWFQTILTDKGKPNITACLLLSDIVYWYRPAEIRDPDTGKFVGYKKKIKADMLQRSYEELADTFNLTKRQVKDAIVLLEQLGVVKRDFRTIKTAAGVRANNVMYLDLVPSKLQEITFPSDSSVDAADDIKQEESQPLEESVDPMTKKRHRCDEKGTDLCREKDTGVTKFRHTNTEITTETTTETIYHISSADEREVFERMFREQIRYDWIWHTWALESFYDEWAVHSILNACVQIACDVYFSTGKYKRISGNDVPVAVVKKQLLMLRHEHICAVIKGVLSAEKIIKNKPAYLLASMINALYTSDVELVNKIVTDFGQDELKKGGGHE